MPKNPNRIKRLLVGVALSAVGAYFWLGRPDHFATFWVGNRVIFVPIVHLVFALGISLVLRAVLPPRWTRARASTAMNKERASKVLLEQLEKFKTLSYAQLKERVLRGESGSYDLSDGDTKFEIEINYFWDSGKPGNIRVAGAINVARGWSAFRPHCEAFIVRPDGSLIE
jgi:hypothetical protein